MPDVQATEEIRISELENVIPLDLETSGLDEQHDQILEVHARSGSIVAGKFVAKVWATQEGGYGGELTRTLPLTTNPLDWHPAVVEMHSKNGLLAEAHKLYTEQAKVARSGIRSMSLLLSDRLDEVDCALAKMFPKLEGKAKWTLLGNSVHFDLRFIKRCLPKFAKNLSHRVIDVSAIRIFTEALGLPYQKEEPAHRAKDDVEYSIRAFEQYYLWAEIHADIHNRGLCSAHGEPYTAQQEAAASARLTTCPHDPPSTHAR